ncbi:MULTISPECIES: hypothetical protein [Curtobacterium]|uniref:Asp23/Gls24 family envelope stress response protein n=1 Tax=Curtobacterium citreum TaxID=2036 RepID=A0ABU8YBQ7_9MICO|nr:hypothetical protein [Curtobacterium sp. JUb34]ROR36280.1 hypothetical protein EDF63_0398 [Curtobacterium sp. JUb34]
MSDDVDDRHGAFTLDELSDYLDADRTPVRADIEGDPDAVAALERLQVLRRASRDLLDTEASADGDERWISSVLASIRTTAHAGRDIPVPDDDPAAHLVVTEGALRGLVRTLGDDVPGVVVRRTRFSGDVGVPGGAVDVDITVVATLEASVSDRAEALRAHVTAVLGAHAPFRIRSVVVRVADVVVGGTP